MVKKQAFATTPFGVGFFKYINARRVLLNITKPRPFSDSSKIVFSVRKQGPLTKPNIWFFAKHSKFATVYC
jgi:hypothetical protein